MLRRARFSLLCTGWIYVRVLISFLFYKFAFFLLVAGWIFRRWREIVPLIYKNPFFLGLELNFDVLHYVGERCEWATLISMLICIDWLFIAFRSVVNSFYIHYWPLYELGRPNCYGLYRHQEMRQVCCCPCFCVCHYCKPQMVV